MADSPEPAAPSSDVFAAIDQAMAAARAEAPTDDDAVPQAEPAPVARQPREPAAPAAQAADEDDEAQEQAEPTGQTSEGEPTYSRKDAKRYLDRARQAEERAAKYEQDLAAYNATREQVRQKWGQKLGTQQERERLEQIMADPNTDYQTLQQARGRLAEIRSAHEELAPLYQEIEQSVFATFSNGLQKMDTLPGVDGEAVKKLFAAKSGPDALRLMHQFATDAAKADYEDQIAVLKAEIRDLKTKGVANGRQPVSSNGTAAKGDILSSLFGTDGLPTDEAIARAKTGDLAMLDTSR